MPLRLYNTLGRQLQDFVPLRPGQASLYTCGPTVYAEAHLGNLRTYIFEDILKRTLLANGLDVKHVMNITDVGHLVGDEDEGEDKVERAAATQGMDAWQLAEHYAAVFRDDLASLNVLPPDEWVKATDTIPQQIELVQQLEAKGFTYRTSDGIYFDTSKLPDYGVLEPQRLAGQRAGERVDMGEKRNATDFALWKFSPAETKRQMEWEYDGRMGFPGWHLECSAICQSSFAGYSSGDQPWLDIHCGGVDHVAVHHTNEIAQTQAATGRPLARFWLHGAFLVLAGEQRMGKSEGNALTLRTLQGKMVEPLAYRYFTLQAHYRSPLTFSWQAVEAAQAGWQNLRAKSLALPSGQVDDAACQKFMDAVNDDLNTAKALATLHEYVGAPGATRETVAEVDQVLGLQLLQAPAAVEAPAEVRALADQREAARQAKDWARADELRQQIEAAGWTVRDTSGGPVLEPR